MSLLKTKTGLESQNLKSSAKIVNNTLVLSLPTAESPCVWRMDLSQVKSSALEVIDVKDKDKSTLYHLQARTARGEKQDVASFKNREDAVEILLQVTRALENTDQGGNQERKPAFFSSSKNYDVKDQKTPWLLSSFVIILLFFLFMGLSTWTQTGPDGLGSSSASGTQDNGDIGQPMSADEFLQRF